MNDPFASFDTFGKQKQGAPGHSYATTPMPMPLAAPAAGPYNQFGGMPPAPYGHPGMGMGTGMHTNPFGMPMGGPPLQTMATQQPPKMFPQSSGAAFMTQPGGVAFGGLGMMPPQQQHQTQQQQPMANPFGAAPPPQNNANPFGAQPIMYDSIKNLLQPKPADPFATAPSGPMKPAPLVTQSSTIVDFDPFSPSAATPRMPQTLATGYNAATVDRTGSNGASALAERQNRARQTQDAARNDMSFDTSAFQHANATPKVSLKHMATSASTSEPSRTASVRTAAPSSSSSPFDDSPFFSDSNDAFAGQTVSNLDDDFAPSADRTNSWGQQSSDHESDVLTSCGPNEYDVTFESGRKLGVLMERVDVWSGKREDRRYEVAVVKLVVENGAADRVGVSIGSSVLAINNRSVANDSYTVVLDLIKTAPRPMTIRFKRGAVNKDTTQGNVLSRISNGTFSVGNLTSGNASWTPKYFAYGGAKLDVLQLFVSRAAYHECVISLYEKRAVHTQIQSFRLCRDHKISPIKSKIYKGYGNLHYFSLTVPSLRFVAAKFASEDYDTIKNMWSLAYEAIERKKRMGY